MSPSDRNVACPTPSKIAYLSRGEARDATKKMDGERVHGGHVTPYRCECGWWHVSSMSRKLAKKVGKAKRRRAA